MGKTPKKEAKAKAAVSEGLTKAEKAALVVDRINKRFAKAGGRIRTADEMVNTFLIRRPTGITGLDRWIAGGFPAGGLVQLVGEDGSGKSYLRDRTIAQVQAIYGKDTRIALAQTETIYDKRTAKKNGVRIALSKDEIEMEEDAKKRKLTPEELAKAKDQVGEFYEIRYAAAEELLEATAQMIESNTCQLCSIDSFGALMTRAEMEHDEGLDGKHRGGSAAVITQFMHRLHSALNTDVDGHPNTTTVIGINQYRDNMKAATKFDKQYREAGGWSLKHGKLIDILLSKGGPIWLKEGTKYLNLGKEINWEILKGKAGCHDGPKGKFKFYFGEHGKAYGADISGDLALCGIQEGVIQGSGWYTLTNEEGEVLFKVQGEPNLTKKLRKDPELRKTLKSMIFKKAGLDFLTKEIW